MKNSKSKDRFMFFASCWEFLLEMGLEMQKLSDVQWMAGVALHYVQRIRKGAVPSEKFYAEEVNSFPCSFKS